MIQFDPVLLSLWVGLGLIAGVCGWLYWRFNRLLQLTQSRQRALENDLRDALRGAVGMGHRIVALEKRLGEISSTSGQEHSSVDEFAYTQAMQMLEQGADVSTVASNCGFSNSEAQLMALVQKQLKKASSKSKPNPIDTLP